MGKPPEQLRFVRWLPTALTLPGLAERLCDGIADLVDEAAGGVPEVALLEIQTVPDSTMPGRLLLAGGLLWLTVKPAPLRGDRYVLSGIVVNLTGIGIGTAAQTWTVGDSVWSIKPVEIDCETRDAGALLDEIVAGTAPRELLAFIPLMKRGAEDGIIERWRTLVTAEEDLQRRGDYSLALVFAERVGRDEQWARALEGFTLIESPMIARLLAEHGSKVEAKGRLEGKIEGLVRVLGRWGQPVPADLLAAIRSCTDGARIDTWFDAALAVGSLAEFRQQANL